MNASPSFNEKKRSRTAGANNDYAQRRNSWDWDGASDTKRITTHALPTMTRHDVNLLSQLRIKSLELELKQSKLRIREMAFRNSLSNKQKLRTIKTLSILLGNTTSAFAGVNTITSSLLENAYSAISTLTDLIRNDMETNEETWQDEESSSDTEHDESWSTEATSSGSDSGE